MTQSAPDWMILDRYVHRRDDKEAFPDESSAPLRASSYTSLGQKFEVAFLPANPPAISRFYVRWPGGTKPEEGDGTDIVAANRDLVLLRLTSVEYLEKSPYLKYTQDHFFCIASPEPDTHLQLKRLPVCRKKVTIPPSDNEEQETVLPYVFFPNTVGLLREFVNGSDEDDFVVAQLDKVSPIPGRRRMVAEVCVLRSRLSSDDGDGMWEVEKIEIQHEDVDYNGLWYWSTDDVVTFNKCICWVDYHRGGILFYDALKEKPTISYRRLNINNTSSTSCQTLPGMSRSLCMTREIDRKGYLGNAVLRFVDITRSDSCIFGPLELGSGFTIKSSTLSSQGSVWVEDVNITSEDLWISNISSGLPHEVLMFPLVSTQNFNEVHFLVSQYVEEIKKVSMVSLDLSNKEVLDIVPYMAGGEDIDMVKEKSHLLKGFISSRFPMFLKTKPGRREMLDGAEAAGARAFSAFRFRKSREARAEASEAGPATKAKPATEHQAAGAARAGASEAGPATTMEHQAAGAARAGASEARPATKAKPATEHRRV